MANETVFTPSQVKKAGRVLRHFMQGKAVSPDQVDAAISTVMVYRASHQSPLVKANNGLRSMVRSERCQVEVSQRLKRFMTIVDKLQREPTLPLSSMQVEPPVGRGHRREPSMAASSPWLTPSCSLPATRTPLRASSRSASPPIMTSSRGPSAACTSSQRRSTSPRQRWSSED